MEPMPDLQMTLIPLIDNSAEEDARMDDLNQNIIRNITILDPELYDGWEKKCGKCMNHELESNRWKMQGAWRIYWAKAYKCSNMDIISEGSVRRGYHAMAKAVQLKLDFEGFWTRKK